MPTAHVAFCPALHTFHTVADQTHGFSHPPPTCSKAPNQTAGTPPLHQRPRCNQLLEVPPFHNKHAARTQATAHAWMTVTPHPHPTPGARTCAACMPHTCLVLLLRQVHPENPGFYPISKGPLRRANTLTTKIASPLFPQTLHNHKHNKIGTHSIISLGPLWPFVVSRKYIRGGAGVRGQIQTTTQHRSHGHCQIAAPRAPGIRCAPSGDGLVSVVYKGRYGSQCQGITHSKLHLIKTRDTTAVRCATSDGTNLPSLPATVSLQPRRNMAKVTPLPRESGRVAHTQTCTKQERVTRTTSAGSVAWNEAWSGPPRSGVAPPLCSSGVALARGLLPWRLAGYRVVRLVSSGMSWHALLVGQGQVWCMALGESKLFFGECVDGEEEQGGGGGGRKSCENTTGGPAHHPNRGCNAGPLCAPKSGCFVLRTIACVTRGSNQRVKAR